MNIKAKTLLAGAFALAVSFAATAADWFDGGLGAGTLAGGSWTKGAPAGTTLILESSQSEFTASAAKTLADNVVRIENSVTFTAYDVEDIPDPGINKAGVIVVDTDGAGALQYKGLTKDGWTALAGTPDLENAVSVVIELSNCGGKTFVKYVVGGVASAAFEAKGDAAAVAAGIVTYDGVGEIGSLVGTTSDAALWEGEGTEANPYKVKDLADLAALQVAVTNHTCAFDGSPFGSKCFQLTADLALTEKWPGIGIYDNGGNANAFSGTFDGAGHKVSGLTFANNASGNNYRGFFNQIYNATVKNLVVEGNGFGTEDLPSGEYGCALLCGCANSSTISNCVTMGSIASATHNAAGVVVRIRDASVIACTNQADITGNYTKVAGVCVLNQSSTNACLIADCVNEGDIKAENGTDAGRDGVAGIVAYVGDATLTIRDCANTGAIVVGDGASNAAKAGQIVAYNYSGVKALEGTITGTADVRMIADQNGKNTTRHLATVADGVATFVEDADIAVGGSYKVMATGGAVALPAIGDSITLDETLATAKVTTTATDAEVKKNGNVYTVAAKILPLVKVENFAGALPEGLEAAFAYTITNTPTYLDWNVDYFVSFDKDIKADTVTLKGQYGAYPWMGSVLPATTAGAEIPLVSSFTSDGVAVSDLLRIQPFNCGVGNSDADQAGTKMTVVLKMFQKGKENEAIVLDTTVYEFAAKATPVVPGTDPGEITADSPAAAENKVVVVPQDATAAGIDTPEELTAYQAMFTKTATEVVGKPGTYTVAVEFNPANATVQAVQADIDDKVTKIDLQAVAGGTASTVELETSVKGLYYVLESNASLTGLAPTAEKLGDGSKISFDVPNTGTSGFYRIKVSATSTMVGE